MNIYLSRNGVLIPVEYRQKQAHHLKGTERTRDHVMCSVAVWSYGYILTAIASRARGWRYRTKDEEFEYIVDGWKTYTMEYDEMRRVRVMMRNVRRTSTRRRWKSTSMMRTMKRERKDDFDRDERHGISGWIHLYEGYEERRSRSDYSEDIDGHDDDWRMKEVYVANKMNLRKLYSLRRCR